jgi:hypothetical protein
MSTIEELKTELQAAKKEHEEAKLALKANMGNADYKELADRTERAVDKIKAESALAVAQQKLESVDPNNTVAHQDAVNAVNFAQDLLKSLGKFSFDAD